MPGGQGINIFRLSFGDVPKEALNWRLWLAVGSFGLMGAARGIDEGLITGTFNSQAFQEQVGITDLDPVELANVKGNVSAMVQLGSIPGAMIAFLICDRVGRVWATRQLCLLWILGIVIFLCNNGSVGAVYAGRFIAGIGIGETVVVAPIYLAEVAPAPIRGLCTCVFTGAVYLGIMLAYFANWGAQLHIPDGYNRWAVPTSLHLIFGGIILFLSMFQLESPRYLVGRNKVAKASEVLSKLRGIPAHDPYCQKELQSIELSYRAEIESTHGQGFLGLLKEMFLCPEKTYRLFLLVTAQLLASWSGGGAITLYAADLFALLGVTGQNEQLFSTAIFGVVKLVAALICCLFLVDAFGRKRSLITGISLQLVSMVYVAAFLTAVPGLANKDPGFAATPSQSRAGTAAIVAIYVSGVGWALGWNSAQYLLTAELLPLRIRAACTSLVMGVHFANQYGTSRALPSMLLQHQGLRPDGTFWFFAAVTLIGGFWAWLCIPEASGRSLETIDRLFELPWYKIGLYGKKVADEHDREAAAREAEKDGATVMETEYIPGTGTLGRGGH